MVWGGIVGVLKALTGAHEVVTTIMLNYIAIFFLQYLVVGGPLQLPNSSSVSASISDSAKLPRLLPQTGEFLGLPGGVYRVHAGIFVALLAAAAFWFLLKRMSLGYEIRAVGQSQRAARYAGVNVRRTIIVTMLIAGAFSGLAGAVQMSGLTYNLTDIYSKDSTGFTAIAVSLLGQTTAIGIVLSALLFGALHVGGQFMQGRRMSPVTWSTFCRRSSSSASPRTSCVPSTGSAGCLSYATTPAVLLKRRRPHCHRSRNLSAEVTASPLTKIVWVERVRKANQ